MDRHTHGCIWVVGRPEEAWCSQIFAHLAPVADRLTLRLVASLADVPEGARAITRTGAPERFGALKAADVLALPPAALLHTQPQARPPHQQVGLVVSVVGTDAILGAEVAMLVAEGCAAHGATTLVEARPCALQGFLHDLVDPPTTLESYLARSVALGEDDAPSLLGTSVPTRGYRVLTRARDPLGGGFVGTHAACALRESLARLAGTVIADLDLPGPNSASTGLIDADELSALPRALLGASAGAVLVGRGSLAGQYGLVNLVGEVRALLPKPSQLSLILVGTARRTDVRTLVELLEEVHPGSTARLASVIAIPELELDAVHRSVAPIPPAILAALRPLTESLTRLAPATVAAPVTRVDYPIYEALEALVPASLPPEETS